jgi:hypothetical protein
MKKTILYILAALTLGTGCNKSYNDTIKGKLPDERISDALTAYQRKLSGAPYGWLLIESTTGTAFNQGVSQSGPKAVFAYYMQFNDSNKVTMFSDFDTTMAATPKTSDYRLKSLQRPVLIFDTYTYIHVPCDPNPSVSKSPFGTGFGWGTDFEYSFSDNIPAAELGDTIHLTGNLNSASAVLVKATQQQRDAYYSGQLKTTMTANSQIFNYFKQASSNGTTLFEMTPGLSGSNSVELSWLDGSGNLQTETSLLYYTAGNINFVTPITIKTQKITSMSNLSYDPSTSTISTTINGSAVTITGSTAPLKNDLNAPYAFWQGSIDSRSYYYSNSGFTVNGVDDYYKVTKLANWSNMIYWAKYNRSGTTYYDAFAGNLSGSLTGSALFSPNPPPATSTTLTSFTPDGRIIFKLLGAFGSATSILNTTVRAQILDPSGYYLVLKKDGKTYDMVVASDAKAWIRFAPWWNR